MMEHQNPDIVIANFYKLKADLDNASRDPILLKRLHPYVEEYINQTVPVEGKELIEPLTEFS